METLPVTRDPRVLVGPHTADDAGVVRIGDGRCIVQTLDFLTPIVDDAWTFGAIAAANSLSDVYAMGGLPFTAMNILCWPDEVLPTAMLRDLLRGAWEKTTEAGVLLVGGHSVKNAELMFGLSVTGFVEEDRIWANAGARPGDVLMLTKAIGTGIVSTAVKRHACPPDAAEAARQSMLTLNREARDAGRLVDVHACTDITGNGLAGHAWEMARSSGVGLLLEWERIPLLPHCLDLADAEYVPGGTDSNADYVGEALCLGTALPKAAKAVVLDPQTSGGLLLSVPAGDVERFTAACPAHVVGRVLEGPARVEVR